MDRSADKPNQSKALMETAVGGLCGLGLAAAAALALALLTQGGARGQALDANRSDLESARFECESGAREGVLTGRALGACDVLLRSGELAAGLRARVLTNRAVMLLARGEARAARDDLDQATRLAPDLPEAWLNLSAARIRTGSAALALEAAAEAEARGADPALAAFNRGVALESLERYEDAYAAYVEAARLAPRNATLQAQPARFIWHQAGA